MKIGSRSQVWKGFADKTSGGLTKKDLVRVNGRYKSKKQSERMSKLKLNPLSQRNMLAKKGSKVFGRNNPEKKSKKPKKPLGFFESLFQR